MVWVIILVDVDLQGGGHVFVEPRQATHSHLRPHLS